jgi:hypothetical protein
MDYAGRLAKAFEGTKFSSVPNQKDAYPLVNLVEHNIRELEKLSEKRKAVILDLLSEIFADVIQPRAIEKFGCTDGPAIASIIHYTFHLQQTLEKLGLDKQMKKEFITLGLSQVQVKELQENLMSYYIASFIQLITDLVNRWRLLPRSTAQQTVDVLAAMFLETNHAETSRHN